MRYLLAYFLVKARGEIGFIYMQFLKVFEKGNHASVDRLVFVVDFGKICFYISRNVEIYSRFRSWL